VTIHVNVEHRFAGKVSSTDAGCVQGRTVKLFKVKAVGADHLVGSDTTLASGRYSIYPGGGLRKYYAKVTKAVIGTLVCDGDRSPGSTGGVAPAARTIRHQVTVST
jgi:hypothetical protein